MFLPTKPHPPSAERWKSKSTSQTKTLARLSAAKIPSSDAWSWQPFINSTSSWRLLELAPQKNNGDGKQDQLTGGSLYFCDFSGRFCEIYSKFCWFFVFDLTNWNRWRLRTFRKTWGRKRLEDHGFCVRMVSLGNARKSEAWKVLWGEEVTLRGFWLVMYISSF